MIKDVWPEALVQRNVAVTLPEHDSGDMDSDIGDKFEIPGVQHHKKDLGATIVTGRKNN